MKLAVPVLILAAGATVISHAAPFPRPHNASRALQHHVSGIRSAALQVQGTQHDQLHLEARGENVDSEIEPRGGAGKLFAKAAKIFGLPDDTMKEMKKQVLKRVADDPGLLRPGDGFTSVERHQLRFRKERLLYDKNSNAAARAGPDAQLALKLERSLLLATRREEKAIRKQALREAELETKRKAAEEAMQLAASSSKGTGLPSSTAGFLERWKELSNSKHSPGFTSTSNPAMPAAVPMPDPPNPVVPLGSSSTSLAPNSGAPQRKRLHSEPSTDTSGTTKKLRLLDFDLNLEP